MRSGLRLNYTEDAEDDLRSILEYTLATWGERQRDVYAERLNSVLEESCRHPYSGRARDDLAPGLRSRPIEQCAIFYRIDDQAITIT